MDRVGEGYIAGGGFDMSNFNMRVGFSLVCKYTQIM
jgi:hypothetical protein